MFILATENSIDYFQLLAHDGYVSVNKVLIKELGVEAALLYGELCSEYNYFKTHKMLDADGAFYSTVENVEANIYMNDYSQRKALKLLEERNLLSISKRGLPPKRYIKLNGDALSKLLEANL